MLTSHIRNSNADAKSFTFTFAYHTYFSISDIRYVFSADHQRVNVTVAFEVIL
jgi:D-hexose-6-phosphate mutarotase